MSFAEIKFKGSLLEAHIIENKNNKLFSLVKNAYKKQPNSLFWKEAFEKVSKKQKR